MRVIGYSFKSLTRADVISSGIINKSQSLSSRDSSFYLSLVVGCYLGKQAVDNANKIDIKPHKNMFYNNDFQRAVN